MRRRAIRRASSWVEAMAEPHTNQAQSTSRNNKVMRARTQDSGKDADLRKTPSPPKAYGLKYKRPELDSGAGAIVIKVRVNRIGVHSRSQSQARRWPVEM
jgi:hypothetical protein